MIASSFKARLSGLHVAVVALILAAAALGVDRMLSRTVLGEIIDDALVALAKSEASELRAAPNAELRVHEPEPGTAPPSLERLDKFVQIVRLDGHVVARSTTLGTTQLPVSASLLEGLRQRESVFETLANFGGEPVRVVSIPVELAGTPYAVQVAMSLDDAYALQRRARWLFLVTGLAILASIGLSGAWLARRALAPIDRIVTRARRIGESNLSERLPHPGSADEIGRLVDALNAMLGRIEQGVEVQRRFAAEASHELRTPLARLRTELEVTLRRPRAGAEYEKALHSCLEEVEWLSRLTDQLLTLARVESEGDRAAAADAAPLRSVLEDALRRLAPEAERRHVTLTLAELPRESAAVQIPHGAASLVFVNLLDNAVKFSPRGGRVSIDVTTQDGQAQVSVSDQGPGIPVDEIPRLFEPFYRSRANRPPVVSGIGLGLAICRTLLHRYGGDIAVGNASTTGAIFHVRMPLAHRQTKMPPGESPPGGTQ